MQPRNTSVLAGISLPADQASLDSIQSFVHERYASTGFPAEWLLKIDLVLEEVLLNIFQYAYAPGHPGTVTVECGTGWDGQAFLIRITDQGRPFDPLAAPAPDTSLGIDDRDQGGLGILLVKEISRSQHYCREGGSNVLEIVFAE